MGKNHPMGKRLCSVQKCVRTDDIEEVGDSGHHTFFEMLGNWSLGDYFKKESLTWSYEFLTEVLGFDHERLWVTIFAGDDNAPYDKESEKIWQELGVPKGKIIPAVGGDDNNWWGPAGITGPCGPDSEVHYDKFPKMGVNGPTPMDPGDRFVEVWNNVFSQYYKDDRGKFSELPQKNVDTGLGLERTLATVNGYTDNYQTGLFLPLIETLENLSGKSYPREPVDSWKGVKSTKEVVSFRKVCDHIRASVFMSADNVTPSNTEGGYVLRRLLRSAIRHLKLLDVEENAILSLVEVVVDTYKSDYPYLSEHKSRILESLVSEEGQFVKTLDKGVREFKKTARSSKKLSGKAAFDLYQSYGFPLEMTTEMAKSEGIKVDQKGFEKEFKKHQELSRSASAGRFAGGLADHSEETTRLHTATHLLHQALREVLGEQVKQTGSNVTKERLRFDFSYPQKLTEDEVEKVENLVNRKIKEDLAIGVETKSVDEALKEGALAFFKEKYGGDVNVYSIGDFSKEICGGPHVKSTNELGEFKIVKEKSVGKGVRRIRAILK